MDFPESEKDYQEALELLRVYEHSESAHDLLPYSLEMRHLQALRNRILELVSILTNREE